MTDTPNDKSPIEGYTGAEARRILEDHGIARPSKAILERFFLEDGSRAGSRWFKRMHFSMLIEKAKAELDENGYFKRPPARLRGNQEKVA